MQTINEAVSIMIIGIITVFLILFLIVLVGNVLVRLLNKYLPETKSEKLIQSQFQTSNPINEKSQAAIALAIEWATKGKGKVTKITKIQ